MFDGFMPRLYNNGPEPTRLYADYGNIEVIAKPLNTLNTRNH